MSVISWATLCKFSRPSLPPFPSSASFHFVGGTGETRRRCGHTSSAGDTAPPTKGKKERSFPSFLSLLAWTVQSPSPSSPARFAPLVSGKLPCFMLSKIGSGSGSPLLLVRPFLSLSFLIPRHTKSPPSPALLSLLRLLQWPLLGEEEELERVEVGCQKSFSALPPPLLSSSSSSASFSRLPPCTSETLAVTQLCRLGKKRGEGGGGGGAPFAGTKRRSRLCVVVVVVVFIRFTWLVGAGREII